MQRWPMDSQSVFPSSCGGVNGNSWDYEDHRARPGWFSIGIVESQTHQVFIYDWFDYFLSTLKVWWHDAIFLFILIFSSTYIQSITFIQYIHRSPFAEVPLHLLNAGQLSWINLPGVPSWESNSGLPYSKMAHYQLSFIAPFWATSHPFVNFTVHSLIVLSFFLMQTTF